MAHLFDKDPPTLWPASVPMPFPSENSPPVVRAFSFTNVTIWNAYKSVLLVIQGVLP
jgi:hypothetical protein